MAEIHDPRPVFYITLLPTHQLRHISSHNDIHNISSLIFIKRSSRSTSQQCHNNIHNEYLVFSLFIFIKQSSFYARSTSVFFWTQETSKTSSKCTWIALAKIYTKWLFFWKIGLNPPTHFLAWGRYFFFWNPLTTNIHVLKTHHYDFLRGCLAYWNTSEYHVDVQISKGTHSYKNKCLQLSPETFGFVYSEMKASYCTVILSLLILVDSCAGKI